MVDFAADPGLIASSQATVVNLGVDCSILSQDTTADKTEKELQFRGARFN